MIFLLALNIAYTGTIYRQVGCLLPVGTKVMLVGGDTEEDRQEWGGPVRVQIEEVELCLPNIVRMRMLLIIPTIPEFHPTPLLGMTPSRALELLRNNGWFLPNSPQAAKLPPGAIPSSGI